jgi:hypothetical protein
MGARKYASDVESLLAFTTTAPDSGVRAASADAGQSGTAGVEFALFRIPEPVGRAISPPTADRLGVVTLDTAKCER